MKLLFLIIPIIFLFYCCGKSNTASTSSALTIVNAIPNSQPLLMNFSGNNPKAGNDFKLYNAEYQNDGGIGYGSYIELGSYTNLTNLSLSQISDTSHYLFNGTLTLENGGIYSLYLMGSDTSHIDTLFNRDKIPYYSLTGDSVMGVRFLNLSAGSDPLTVTLKNDTTHKAILQNLPYKSISSFQAFPVNTSTLINGYTFEFRNSNSGDILANYPIAITTFKCQTLAFCGSASTGYNILQINNY